jgi:peptidoglycan/xylan/chitin deacetylase (PgdA/CDA1 family)
MGLARGIKKFFSPAKAIVLMYHRIAEPEMDPWQLSVSRDHFESHLATLKATGCVKSVNEVIHDLENNSLSNDCICITFDDGYEDNYLYALPLLEKYECPATFFITTSTIGSNEPYWWDMLAEIFLSADKLPASLNIKINEANFSYQLENEGAMSVAQRKMNAAWHWPEDTPTQRAKIYFEIWMTLRDQQYHVIRKAVDEIKQWSGLKPINTSGNFPMSESQLRKLSEHKYAFTGLHTHTHSALGTLSTDQQLIEINLGKQWLDEKLNINHVSLAYPYGSYNKETSEAVKKAGLSAAFTTDAHIVTGKSNRFQLGRIQATDQTGEQLKQKLDTLLNK